MTAVGYYIAMLHLEREAMQREIERLQAEVATLRADLLQAADRIAAQSELLSRYAEHAGDAAHLERVEQRQPGRD